MSRFDRRTFIRSALATALATRLPRLAHAQGTDNPRRIDVHHHFAPPAWVTDVRGRPLLNPANTTWRARALHRGYGRGWCRRSGNFDNEPRTLVRRYQPNPPPGASLQRVRCDARSGASDSIRAVRRPATAGRRCEPGGDCIRLRYAQCRRCRALHQLQRRMVGKPRHSGR